MPGSRKRIPQYPDLIGGKKRKKVLVSFTTRSGKNVSFMARKPKYRKKRQQTGGINFKSILKFAGKAKRALTGKTANKILRGVKKAINIAETGQKYIQNLPDME